MNKKLSFEDIFEYKSVSFKIAGVEYDIMKQSDVEKIPCLPAKANIFGQEYYMDDVLKENANYIYKHGGDFSLADACLQKAKEISSTIPSSVSRPQKENRQVSPLPLTFDNELRKKYAITLMLWGHDRHAFEYKPNRQYPTYYQYECGLSNPNLLMEQLLNDGFFQEAAFCEIFETYTVKELSVIADSLGISKKGKKSELIARILEHSTPVELHKHLNGKIFFSLSPKGKTYLQSNQDYMCLHKYNTMRISLEEYECVKKELQTNDGEAILIHILNQKIAQNRYDEPTHAHLKQLYDNIGNLHKAMFEFLLLLYFRINCLWQFQWIFKDLTYESREQAIQDALNHAYPEQYIRIENAAYFSKNIKYFDAETIDFIYQNYPLKFLLIDKPIYLEILDEMNTQAFFNVENWNDLIYDSYIHALKNI